MKKLDVLKKKLLKRLLANGPETEFTILRALESPSCSREVILSALKSLEKDGRVKFGRISCWNGDAEYFVKGWRAVEEERERE